MHGQSVITVEGVGNAQKGYHTIQQEITNCNGSQCGFCTPGMVMAMYGLVAKNPKPTPLQVEEQLDGESEEPTLE